jgi:hypothetical protein
MTSNEHYYILFTHEDFPWCERFPELKNKWVIYSNNKPLAYSHDANLMHTMAYRLNVQHEANKHIKPMQSPIRRERKPLLRTREAV